MHSSARFLVLALGGAALTGCHFSAKAGGNADSASGQANLEGSATSTEASAAVETRKRPQRTIHYEQGKLSYEGVINFEYNRSELKNDEVTQKTLKDFQAFLESHPDIKIEVQGHTDSRGSDEYNRDLSDRRAASVKAWLEQAGIAEGRVTSIGKGEDEPQVAEPAACDDKAPVDTSSCEEPWAKNRRVVFEVTEGGAQLQAEEEPPPPPPPVEVAEPAPVEEPACRWLVGPRLGALGPNSWVNANVAVQPCVDWLELSLGVGLGVNGLDVDDDTPDVDADYWAYTVPLRARLWLLPVHSPIADLGIGITHYDISGEAAGGFEYDRSTTPLIGHLGIGYGFRPQGPGPGLRLAILGGALFHFTQLGDSDINGGTLSAQQAAALQRAMDAASDELHDIEPYAEVSAGWMF